MHHHLNPEMQACMDACHTCHVSCLSMAMTHCLELGGTHAEPRHMRLMLDCAEICALTINFIARSSDHHRHICRECAEICRACAESCEGLSGMEECAATCRRCAAACEKMAA